MKNSSRQLLRENSPELRDLERKLKAAYINKELAAQIAQKEHEKNNKRVRYTMLIHYKLLHIIFFYRFKNKIHIKH